MSLLSMISRSSVDTAPTRCSVGHGFDSSRGFSFSFVPPSCHDVDPISSFINCVNVIKTSADCWYASKRSVSIGMWNLADPISKCSYCQILLLVSRSKNIAGKLRDRSWNYFFHIFSGGLFGFAAIQLQKYHTNRISMKLTANSRCANRQRHD